MDAIGASLVIIFGALFLVSLIVMFKKDDHRNKPDGNPKTEPAQESVTPPTTNLRQGCKRCGGIAVTTNPGISAELRGLCSICLNYTTNRKTFDEMFARCTTRSEINRIFRAQARKHHPDVVEGRRKKEFETDEAVLADAAASPPKKMTAKEKARLERVFSKFDGFKRRWTEIPFKALQDAYESALQKMDPVSRKRG